MAAGAQVVTDHLIGKYATTDDGCAGHGHAGFEIRRGVVEDPTSTASPRRRSRPATASEAYESNCTAGVRMHFGTRLNFASKADHIRISLPEKQDWITLYPCK